MLSRTRGPVRAPGAQARAARTVRNLLSPEQLNVALLRESSRVDRGGAGDLTFVLFHVINPKKKHALSTIRLIKTILERVRVTDDLGWFDRDHVGLLLPDTTSAGAWALAQSVCDLMEKQNGTRPQTRMYTYPAIEEAQGVIRCSELTTPAIAGHAEQKLPPIRVAS